MSIYSDDTNDLMGTTTYNDDGRYHVQATTITGRRRPFHYHADAVKWLTVQYNRTH